MKAVRKVTVSLALVTGVALVVTAAASAHAIVSPAVVKTKALQQFTLSVPTEKEGKTTFYLNLVKRPDRGPQGGDDLAPIGGRELVPDLVQSAPRQPLADVPRAIRTRACANAPGMWNRGLREQADHPCLVEQPATQFPVAETDDQRVAHPYPVHPARRRREAARIVKARGGEHSAQQRIGRHSRHLGTTDATRHGVDAGKHQDAPSKP